MEAEELPQGCTDLSALVSIPRVPSPKHCEFTHVRNFSPNLDLEVGTIYLLLTHGISKDSVRG